MGEKKGKKKMRERGREIEEPSVKTGLASPAPL